MFTIKFQQKDQIDEVEKETIERAQSYARRFMNYYEKTEVYVTAAPDLKIFEATQFEIIKETL